MKLRKNQIISPKNLQFPREQIKNIHRAIWEFLGRNWNKLIFYMPQPWEESNDMSEEIFLPHMKIDKFLRRYSLFLPACTSQQPHYKAPYQGVT